MVYMYFIFSTPGHFSSPSSEVAVKMILMGHPVSSCHVPVDRSCFILFHTLISSWKYCHVHLSLHVITPYIVHFSHLYISTKRLIMSHFRTFLSRNTFSKHVITSYIVRFSQLYFQKNILYCTVITYIFLQNGVKCPIFLDIIVPIFHILKACNNTIYCPI